jgi:gas vesicle protein
VGRFLLGLGIGAAVGILCAPASGRETLIRLGRKAGRLAAEPQAKAADALEKGKEQAAEVAADVARKATEAAVEAIRKDVLHPGRTA